MTADWATPSKGRHVFVVLRHDDHVSDPVQAVMGTMAFTTLDRAEAEAERLNGLNADKGARYFVVVVRLQDDPEA